MARGETVAAIGTAVRTAEDHQSSATGSSSTAKRDTLTYDARGKILRADNLSSVFTQWYAGLGALWATDWANLGDQARNREEFTVDPLGHVARRKAFRDQQQSTDPTEWITRYALGSSAVQRQAAVWPTNTPGFRADSTEQERDVSGNLSRDREWGWGTLWTGVTGVTRKAEARHFYDAEQRLRVLQRQDDTSDGANFSARPACGRSTGTTPWAGA